MRGLLHPNLLVKDGAKRVQRVQEDKLSKSSLKEHIDKKKFVTTGGGLVEVLPQGPNWPLTPQAYGIRAQVLQKNLGVQDGGFKGVGGGVVFLTDQVVFVEFHWHVRMTY
jgi:hypothetical protein